MSELVKKSDVMTIWENYWESSMSVTEMGDRFEQLEVINKQPTLNENQPCGRKLEVAE